MQIISNCTSWSYNPLFRTF